MVLALVLAGGAFTGIGQFARLITFWLPAVPALLLLPSMRRLSERLRSVPHTKRDLEVVS